jgi:hypothetical protein
VEQQHGGRARLAVLHEVHVTIVKPNETAAGIRIAGHVPRHRDYLLSSVRCLAQQV